MANNIETNTRSWDYSISRIIDGWIKFIHAYVEIFVKYYTVELKDTIHPNDGMFEKYTRNDHYCPIELLVTSFSKVIIIDTKFEIKLVLFDSLSNSNVNKNNNDHFY